MVQASTDNHPLTEDELAQIRERAEKALSEYNSLGRYATIVDIARTDVIRLLDTISADRAEIGRLRTTIEAALDLSAAVTDYRHTHDMKGDGHIETGRAWDRMRNANTKFRTTLFPEGLARKTAKAIEGSDG
jgi:hypothetical protein